MSLKDCSELAAIVVALLAIPASFYYIIKIAEWFKTNKKQTTELINKVQDDKLPYDMPWRVAPYSIFLTYLFGIIGVGLLISFIIDIMTTIPQKGFGGPLPKWGGCLLFMPPSGFVFSWIFLNMMDTYYCLYPKDFKKPYTKARRSFIARVSFIIGMSLPWLESIVQYLK
jgi:hypothetical protein